MGSVRAPPLRGHDVIVINITSMGRGHDVIVINIASMGRGHDVIVINSTSMGRGREVIVTNITSMGRGHDVIVLSTLPALAWGGALVAAVRDVKAAPLQASRMAFISLAFSRGPWRPRARGSSSLPDRR